MSTPNQSPTSPERTFAHQEIIEFNDGNLVIGFRTPGDKLILGDRGEYGHKYARDLHLNDMAIIKTKSGNAYGLARGIVINKERQQAYELPEEPISITIGEPCVIPGVGSTSDVESVMLRYGITSPGYTNASERIDAPNPFEALEAQVDAINVARQQG